MYSFIQLIRHKLPIIWNVIEYVNATAFQFRYGRKVDSLSNLILKFNNDRITYHLAEIVDAPKLVDFFRRQPEEAFQYFKPHGFDIDTIKKIIKNPSFIVILAKSESSVVGYAFLRCFSNGKSFRGKIVDIDYRGQGIAKQFGIITTEVAQKIGVGLYGTISKGNVSSMKSSESSNEIKVIEELSDDFLLIQYLPKR